MAKTTTGAFLYPHVMIQLIFYLVTMAKTATKTAKDKPLRAKKGSVFSVKFQADAYHL